MHAAPTLVFFGNCQMRVMHAALSRACEHCGIDVALHIGPDVHEQTAADAQALQAASRQAIGLFTQVVNNTRFALSSEALSAWSADTRQLTVVLPSMHCNAYWPNQVNLRLSANEAAAHPGDGVIYSAIERGASDEAIAQLLHDPDLYSQDEVRPWAELAIARLRERETQNQVTVRLSDRLQAWVTQGQERPFYIFNHPKKPVFDHFVQATLPLVAQVLGCRHPDRVAAIANGTLRVDYDMRSIDFVDTRMLPSVARHLGIAEDSAPSPVYNRTRPRFSATDHASQTVRAYIRHMRQQMQHLTPAQRQANARAIATEMLLPARLASAWAQVAAPAHPAAAAALPVPTAPIATATPPVAAPPAPRPGVANLSMVMQPNVTLTPLRMDPQAPTLFSLGAFLEDGTFAPDFTLRRNWGSSGQLPRPSPAEWDSAAEQGQAIYGGILFGHFGHFLLESLSRVWALAKVRRNLPIVWHLQGQTALLPWQQEILALLKIPTERFVLVDRPLRFEAMLVPTPGYQIQNVAHPHHVQALTIRQPQVPRHHKLWLSRAKLHAWQAQIGGELEVEALLHAQGWQIVHPESLSVAEQLKVLNSASVVAGFEGSAFHTLLLLEHAPQVVVFTRSQQPINSNYWTIAQARGIQQRVHAPDFVPAPGPGGRPGVRLARAQQIVDWLAGL